MSIESEQVVTQVAAKGSDHKEKLGWREVPAGAVVVDAGNSVEYQTGDWRSERPVIDFNKCIQCLFCWGYCPDGAVITENQKVIGINYYHCKGCGICSTECPAKCIEMIDELTALREENLAASKSDGSKKPDSTGKGAR